MSEGEKMSKSLGNFYTVRGLLEEFPGEAIRLHLLQTHYRQPLDFNKAAIAEARRTLDRWYRGGENFDEDKSPPGAVIAALSDDLNTPKAIAELHKLFVTDPSAFYSGARLLGFFAETTENWFKWRGPKAAGDLDSEKIEILLEERKKARQQRDFKTSDKIRDDLATQGIILEDGPLGTGWRRN